MKKPGKEKPAGGETEVSWSQAPQHAKSHPIKLVMGFGRKAERNGISGADLAARQYDPHNAGLSREIALRIPAEQGGRKTVLIGIQLPTRISKAGHLHHGMGAEL